MATVTPNFNWPVPTSTDLVKDGATAIEALGDSIDASLVDLKGGTTGQVLAKASGTDMDFNWVAQDDSNAIQNAIVDAKGDLIAATAADTPARLAVGTDGQVLTADSTAATGLKWATASGGTMPKLSFVTNANNFSTSSTSYVDVTGYTITITPVSATNTIQVTANLAVQIGTSSDTAFKLLVDGVNVAIRTEAPFENGEGEVTIVGYVTNLAASAKVCKLQMRAIGGISTTVYGANAGYISNLSVLEIY